MLEVADNLAVQGADVFVTSDLSKSARQLPFASDSHPLVDPLLLIVAFYIFIEKLARARGANPDSPPNLRKITETV